VIYPKKRDYPEVFTILGHQWSIKWVRPSEDRPWNALCEFPKRRITLTLARGPRLTFEDFVHELVHALAFELNLPKLHNHRWIKKLEQAVPGLVLSCKALLPS
jgi:hypothetical protein